MKQTEIEFTDKFVSTIDTLTVIVVCLVIALILTGIVHHVSSTPLV